MAGPPGVEDPISAVFDLADRAAAMGPVVRRLYRYTAAILVAWIAIMAVVIVVGLAAAGWLSVLALVGLAAGVIALGLLRQTDRFFREFVRRHRWISMVREAEPTVKVPEGRTPVERLARFLSATNPRVDRVLAARPEAARFRVTLPGPRGAIPFDLVIDESAGPLNRWLGTGEEGFAILARVGSPTPTLEEVRRLEADAIRAAASLGGRVARIILLRAEGGAIPEDVYDYVVGHPVQVPWGFGRPRASLEIISENPDRTYDLVPRVVGVP